MRTFDVSANVLNDRLVVGTRGRQNNNTFSGSAPETYSKLDDLSKLEEKQGQVEVARSDTTCLHRGFPTWKLVCVLQLVPIAALGTLSTLRHFHNGSNSLSERIIRGVLGVALLAIPTCPTWRHASSSELSSKTLGILLLRDCLVVIACGL